MRIIFIDSCNEAHRTCGNRLERDGDQVAGSHEVRIVLPMSEVKAIHRTISLRSQASLGANDRAEKSVAPGLPVILGDSRVSLTFSRLTEGVV